MTLIQMSISGAVLITAILLIRALTINRLPKQTFLILWGLVIVRLLVPFTIPFPLSIYSLILRNIPIEMPAELSSGILISEAPSDPVLEALSDTSAPNVPAQQTPDSASNASTAPFTGSSALAAFLPADSAVFIIRCLGTLLCAAFFVLSYLRCRLEFSTSLPISNTYVNRWLECRHIRRHLSVRQSDRINTPLTYGILHPVILFPRQTDWTNTLELQYVLSHEYVHIRRLCFRIRSYGRIFWPPEWCSEWHHLYARYFFYRRRICRSARPAV